MVGFGWRGIFAWDSLDCFVAEGTKRNFWAQRGRHEWHKKRPCASQPLMYKTCAKNQPHPLINYEVQIRVDIGKKR